MSWIITSDLQLAACSTRTTGPICSNPGVFLDPTIFCHPWICVRIQLTAIPNNQPWTVPSCSRHTSKMKAQPDGSWLYRMALTTPGRISVQHGMIETPHQIPWRIHIYTALSMPSIAADIFQINFLQEICHALAVRALETHGFKRTQAHLHGAPDRQPDLQKAARYHRRDHKFPALVAAAKWRSSRPRRGHSGASISQRIQ